ncbi:MAG: DUF3617 domain-containing protein [Myxococcota bacterium]
MSPIRPPARVWRRLAGPLALGLLLPAAPGLAADSLPVKPGLWRTKSTQTMEVPGMGTMPPRIHEGEECLREGDFDPAKMMDPSSGCRVENVKVEGNVMSYEVTCPTPEGSVTGKARYESNGDQGKGHVDMAFDMGDAKGRMTMDMSSQRIGDCP